MIKQINSDLYGSRNHGGVDAWVGGKKCGLGSIRGYAIYNLYLWNIPKMEGYKREAESANMPLDDFIAYMIVREVSALMARAVARKERIYWVNRHASVITSSPGYYEAEAAKWANAPRLEVGDIIDFDGALLRVEPDNNGNFKLTPI